MNGIFGIVYKNKGRTHHTGEMEKALSGRKVQAQVQHNEAALLSYHYPNPLQLHGKPACMEAEGLLVTADIRIDNRPELLKLLAIKPEVYHACADVALLAAAYRKWGEQCVKKIEGEFAFCIVDKLSGDVFMATDPLGQRHFFYYDSPQQLIFCSEIAGVLAMKPEPHYFDPLFIINDYVAATLSPFNTYTRDVVRSANASTFTLKGNRFAEQRYWQLEPKGKYKLTKFSDWADELKNQICHAVECRLDHEAAIGICLSGGLDSSGLACILSELLLKRNKPLHAFSSVLPVGYKGIEHDERRYIEAVTRQCPNIIPVYINAPGAGPLTGLSPQLFDTIAAMPPASSYVTRAILESAQECNVQNMFWGLAGDTWPSWAGDGVVGRMINNGKLWDAFTMAGAMSRTEQKPKYRVFIRELLRNTSLFSWYIGTKMKKNGINWQSQTFLSSEIAKAITQKKINNGKQPKWMQMRGLIEQGLLTSMVMPIKNDSRVYGMDAELPFLDKRLLEFLVEVPEDIFLPNGQSRGLYRNAMSGIIPQEILGRMDKTGYAPDFNRRAMQQSTLIAAILNDKENGPIFEKYIDTKGALSYLASIKPVSSTMGLLPEKVMSRRIGEAAIICKFLAHLNAKKYIFN